MIVTIEPRDGEPTVLTDVPLDRIYLDDYWHVFEYEGELYRIGSVALRRGGTWSGDAFNGEVVLRPLYPTTVLDEENDKAEKVAKGAVA